MTVRARIIALLLILPLSVLSRAVWTSVQYPTSYKGTVVEATIAFHVVVRTAAGDTMTLQLAGIDAPVPVQDVHAEQRDAALEATAQAVEQYLSEILVGKTVSVRFATGAQTNILEPPLAHLYRRGPLPGWRTCVSQQLLQGGYALAYQSAGLSTEEYQRYLRLEA